MRDAGWRAILADGGFLAIGPKWLADAGGYALGVTWSGQAFRVYDSAGTLRATTASWAAADAMVATLTAEWDAEMTTA